MATQTFAAGPRTRVPTPPAPQEYADPFESGGMDTGDSMDDPAVSAPPAFPPQTGLTPPPTIQPRRAQSPSLIDPRKVANTSLQRHEARQIDDLNRQDNYNQRVAEQQNHTQQVDFQRQQAAEQKRLIAQTNSAAQAANATSGVRSYTDRATGLITPVVDPAGKPVYTRHDGDEYQTEDGRVWRDERDESGATRRVPRDTFATNPATGEFGLMHKESGQWLASVDPDEAVTKDPAQASAAAVHLLARDRAATQQDVAQKREAAALADAAADDFRKGVEYAWPMNPENAKPYSQTLPLTRKERDSLATDAADKDPDISGPAKMVLEHDRLREAAALAKRDAAHASAEASKMVNMSPAEYLRLRRQSPKATAAIKSVVVAQKAAESVARAAQEAAIPLTAEQSRDANARRLAESHALAAGAAQIQQLTPAVQAQDAADSTATVQAAAQKKTEEDALTNKARADRRHALDTNPFTKGTADQLEALDEEIKGRYDRVRDLPDMDQRVEAARAIQEDYQKRHEGLVNPRVEASERFFDTVNARNEAIATQNRRREVEGMVPGEGKEAKRFALKGDIDRLTTPFGGEIDPSAEPTTAAGRYRQQMVTGEGEIPDDLTAEEIKSLATEAGIDQKTARDLYLDHQRENFLGKYGEVRTNVLSNGRVVVNPAAIWNETELSDALSEASSEKGVRPEALTAARNAAVALREDPRLQKSASGALESSFPSAWPAYKEKNASQPFSKQILGFRQQEHLDDGKWASLFTGNWGSLRAAGDKLLVGAVAGTEGIANQMLGTAAWLGSTKASQTRKWLEQVDNGAIQKALTGQNSVGGQLVETATEMLPLMLGNPAIAAAARASGLAPWAAKLAGKFTKNVEIYDKAGKITKRALDEISAKTAIFATAGMQSLGSVQNEATDARRDAEFKKLLAGRDLTSFTPQEIDKMTEQADNAAARSARIPAALAGVITGTLTTLLPKGNQALERYAMGLPSRAATVPAAELMAKLGAHGLSKWLASGTMRAAIGNFVVTAGIAGLDEWTEEWFDQFAQGVIAKMSYDPSKTMGQIISESLDAGGMGALLGIGGGGAVEGLHAAKQATTTAATNRLTSALPEDLAVARHAISNLTGPVDRHGLSALVTVATGGIETLQDRDLKVIGLKRNKTGEIVEDASYKSPDGVPPVKMENGLPVITQGAIDRATAAVPSLADVIRPESDVRAAYAAPPPVEAPAPEASSNTPEAPSNAPTETSNAPEAPSNASTEASNVPSNKQPALDFKTSKGSTYTIHEDGTTTRDKAARPEHPGEEGVQERSHRTVYVDEQTARSLQPPQGDFRIHDDGKGGITTAAPGEDGKWGASPSARGLSYSETPEVGSVPVELWESDNIGFRKVHFGNRIVKVTGKSIPGTESGKPATTPPTAQTTDATVAHHAVPETPKEIHAFLTQKLSDEHFQGRPSKQQAAQIKRVVDATVPQLTRWRRAFPNIVFRSGADTPGGVQVFDGELQLDKNILRNSAVVRLKGRMKRLVLHEAIHAVAVSMEKAGSLDVEKLWQEASKDAPELVKAVAKSHGGKDHTPYQLAHEFFRMVTQQRIQMTQKGFRASGKALDEQVRNRDALKIVREMLNTVLQHIRSLIAAASGAHKSDLIEAADEVARVLSELEEKAETVKPEKTEAPKTLEAAKPDETAPSEQKQWNHLLSVRVGQWHLENRDLRRAIPESLRSRIATTADLIRLWGPELLSDEERAQYELFKVTQDSALKPSDPPNPTVQTLPEGTLMAGPAEFTIAHHGTPHEVDKFSTEKIGTGEGAQVYGWGLYFAQNEGVAGNYQRNLTERNFINRVKEDFSEFDTPEDQEKYIQNAAISEGERNLLQALKEEDWWGFDFPHQAVQAALREPESFDPSEKTLEAIRNFGNRYTVELPPEDTMLDWDAPMGEQSAPVRQALGDDVIQAHLDKTGGRFYNTLKSAAGPEKLSKQLLLKGIRGIRFLDQKSRKSTEGTRNYVIFDDKDVRIVARNGKPVEGTLQGSDPMDADYMAAVESGNLERAQQMVDAAAKKAGLVKLSRAEGDGAPFGYYEHTTERLENLTSSEGAVRRGNEGSLDALIESLEGVDPKDVEPLYVSELYDDGTRDVYNGNHRLHVWKDHQTLPGSTEVPVLARVDEGEPVVHDDDGDPIPLSQRFNPDSDSILYASDPTPGLDPDLPEDFYDALTAMGIDPDELFRSLDAAIADKTKGRPDLADSTGDRPDGTEAPEIRGSDLYYTEHASPESIAKWTEDATAIVEKLGYKAVLERMMLMSVTGEIPTGGMTFAQKWALEDDGTRLHSEAALLRHMAYRVAYRGPGTEAGRAMRARVDQNFTPAERNMRFLGEIILDPSDAVNAGIKKKAEKARKQAKDAGKSQQEADAAAKRVSEREALKEATERIQKLEKAFAKSGLTINDVLNGAQFTENTPLYKKILSQMAEWKQKALNGLVGGENKFGTVASQLGRQEAAILGARKEFEALLRKSVFERIKAGESAEALLTELGTTLQGSDPSPTTTADTDAEREFQRLLSLMGLTSTKAQGRTKVVTKPITPKVPSAAKPPVIANTTTTSTPSAASGSATLHKFMTYVDPDDVHQIVSLARAAEIELQDTTSWAFDVARELSFNFMLSGIKTQVANVTGNTINSLWNLTANRGVEAMLASVLRLVGLDPKRHGAFAKEVTNTFSQLGPALKDGAELAIRTWKTGYDFFGWDQDDHLHSAITPEALAKHYIRGAGRQVIQGKKGQLIRLPSRMLGAMDSLAKGVVARIEAVNVAERIAKSEKLKGGSYRARVSELMDDRRSAAWRFGIESARDYAFQTPYNLDDPIEGGLAKVDAWLAKEYKGFWANFIKFVIGTKFLPFRRTPYNIYKTAIRKTPLGSLALAWKSGRAAITAARTRGTPEAVSFYEAYPKFVQRSAEQLLGWTMAAMLAGIVEGGDDDGDKDLLFVSSPLPKRGDRGENALRNLQQGGNWYLRFGNRETGVKIPLGAVEPTGTSLAMMADALRAVNLQKADTAQKWAAAGNFFVNQMQDKTFLRGLGDLLAVIQGDKSAAQMGKEWAAQSVAPNIVRQMLSGEDPFVREGKTRDFKAVALGGKESDEENPVDQAQKIDATGKPIEKEGNAIVRQLATVPSKTDTPLPVWAQALVNYNRQNYGAKDEVGRDLTWGPAPLPTKVEYTDARGVRQEITLSAKEYRHMEMRIGELTGKALKSVPRQWVTHLPPAGLQMIRRGSENAVHQAKLEIIRAHRRAVP